MLDMRCATMDDFDNACRLFDDVIAHQPLDTFTPKWTAGIYPTADDLRSRIEAGEMYLGEVDGELAAAVVLTREEDPEYVGAAWPSGATGDEVSVVHLLAIHPKFRGRGLGAEVMRFCIESARSWGKRAIHLDVVPGNLAASRIYTSVGFELVTHHEVFYEDLGRVLLEMYELVL
ncbi:MAG: GNAT family N-acetyltransferase [Atopobiaceae bacterium]|nr:GNAT family N-acetyltransferase [Atopobiaceae bacterium]MBQ3282810.1 GNAT family N-acetyltransferase [Atopobiaceae bacterium]MBQ6410735.1 GNAT family N-acetyltransferase [Atopobiaceae bacterium]MBQ6649939.1 GNAT family N-acetyltransferase [Atopobiaceae bacterium]MBR3385511.1 GNAT family N-acetyltransferase [Atopobiaceae bacterium]